MALVADYLGALSGMPAKEREKRIDILTEKVNLEGQKKKKVKKLSGGMKRRLGIACALAEWPPILLLAEEIRT